jgi:hypothetical protein
MNKDMPFLLPEGSTNPGYLPSARLSKFASLITQHHESIHHDLNCTTTLGNCIALLSDLSKNCKGELAQNARHIATVWNECQASRCEGLVCYVAYKRSCRRNNQITKSIYEDILPKSYLYLFKYWFDKYNNLPTQDNSKDALAMHIGEYCLNIPLYDQLSNLSKIDSCLTLITEKLIESRFNMLENAIFCNHGKNIIAKWDREVSKLWLQDKDIENTRRIESKITYDLFHRLSPDIQAVPSEKVPNSIFLAQSWNEQLSALGYADEVKVTITNMGLINSIEKVVIHPPAPTLTQSLFEIENTDSIFEILDSNLQSYCLVILHYDKENSHVFSRKYGRILKPGEIYARFSFVKPDLNQNRYDVGDGHFFAIIAPEQRPSWFTNFKHPRLVITNSAACQKNIIQAEEFKLLPINNLWSIHWNQTARSALEQISLKSADILGFKLVLMTVSNSSFWIINFQGNHYLDIYPIPWDLHELIIDLLNTNNFQALEIENSMLFGILGLLISVGF